LGLKASPHDVCVCLVLVVFPAYLAYFAPTPNPVARARPKARPKPGERVPKQPPQDNKSRGKGKQRKMLRKKQKSIEKPAHGSGKKSENSCRAARKTFIFTKNDCEKSLSLSLMSVSVWVFLFFFSFSFSYARILVRCMQVRCLSLLFASQFLRAPFPDNKFVNNIENSTTAAREQPKLPNKRPEQPPDKSKSKRANKLTTLDDKRKIQTSFAAVSIMGNTVFFFLWTPLCGARLNGII